jgi:hypothetical protein
MILLAYDLAEFDSESISKLLFERVIDMLLGCAIALVGTAAAFPRTAVAELDSLAEEEPDAAGKERSGRTAAGEWRVIGAQVCIASRAALPAAHSAIRA